MNKIKLIVLLLGGLCASFAVAQSSKENCDDKHGGCLLDVSVTGDNAEHQFIIRQTCGQGTGGAQSWKTPALYPAYNHGQLEYRYYTHNNSEIFKLSTDKVAQISMDRCKKGKRRRGELFAYEVIDVTAGKTSYGRQWQASYAFDGSRFAAAFIAYAHCKAIMIDVVAHTWYCTNPRY